MQKINRKPNKRRTRVSPVLFLAVLLLGGLIVGKLMTNAQYNERASYLSGLKDEYEICCNEQIQLDVRLGKLANLDSIEEIAVTQLGMSKITQHQIEYVNLGGEDYAEVMEGDSGLGGVFRSFSMIWEYLN